MATRRGFLASLLATASLPGLTWADAGNPQFLAAAREPDGTYALFGLTDQGRDTFRIPLPGRGHAAAAHPHRPEAVAFARRPGTFALVINCASGRVIDRLTAPDGHHFSGHGAFSADGTMLFTSEVENASGAGRIGQWRTEDYARIGGFSSHGVGPHEILRIPGSDVLAVANGGIIAALDDDRTKLNIDSMAPNLSYIATDGTLIDRMALPWELHQNSIRHLSALPDGTVAFAMQWEGDAHETPPLLGLHRAGTEPTLCELPEPMRPRPKNYAGSVAFSGNGAEVAITCPRGGVLLRFAKNGRFVASLDRADICGIGPLPDGFLATDGLGALHRVDTTLHPLLRAERAWDNHLVVI